jgi:hypothetical protein
MANITRHVKKAVHEMILVVIAAEAVTRLDQAQIRLAQLVAAQHKKFVIQKDQENRQLLLQPAEEK